MTVEQVLQDIRSDRVKKVIDDGDFSAEIDDQYAMAYLLGSDKIDLLGVNAEAYFEEPVATDTKEVMLRSYAEIERVYGYLGITGEDVPYFKGAESQISNNPGYAPSDSPAARNIIKVAHEMKDEPLYVVVTGPTTNVVSACMIDPSIMDKIVVVWVGGMGVYYDGEAENKRFHEWNLCADVAAAKFLFNNDIPLIFLPTEPEGSCSISQYYRDFGKIKGDSPAGEFFRTILPSKEATGEKYQTKIKVMCDLMGPAVLIIPDSMEYRIVPAPVLTDENSYALDYMRRKIIYGYRPNSEMIVNDMLKTVEKLINK